MYRYHPLLLCSTAKWSLIEESRNKCDVEYIDSQQLHCSLALDYRKVVLRQLMLYSSFSNLTKRIWITLYHVDIDKISRYWRLNNTIYSFIYKIGTECRTFLRFTIYLLQIILLLTLKIYTNRMALYCFFKCCYNKMHIRAT